MQKLHLQEGYLDSYNMTGGGFHCHSNTLHLPLYTFLYKVYHNAWWLAHAGIGEEATRRVCWIL